MISRTRSVWWFFFFFLPGWAVGQQTTDAIHLTTEQLQALSGEYTSADEPDLPVSFYVQEGKLFTESERHFPTALTVLSATELADGDDRYRFSLNGSGRAANVSVAYKGDPVTYVMPRTGEAVRHPFPAYERQEATIPMRDGIKLHAVILTPAGGTGPFPILLDRTPYGVDGLTMKSFYTRRPELARAQYIYVGEDIRGRFKSEGTFELSRMVVNHSDPKVTDESTDAYDTVAWLIKNIPGNNGRVGVIGTSYDGALTMAAGIDPHPAVKAISPQAPMIDTWLGDDFFHNGAFRQTYGYDYAMGLEQNKEMSDVSYGRDVDGFDYFLERGSFAEDVRRSDAKTLEGKVLPTWQIFLEHPSYDHLWYVRGVQHHMKAVTVPTLEVGGYYDQEDMWGPQEVYATLEPRDTRHENFLVLGPWRHGSWSASTRSLGALKYGEPIGTEYRKQIEAPFFAKYLKEEPGFDLEDTASFQTGSNVWKRYPHFPPAQATPTRLYLATDRLRLQMGKEKVRVSYLSDPADPVPYRHRPIQPTYAADSQWRNWMTEDQRFATGRKDVAIWTMGKLDHDITVTGEVIADIFASTTGSDLDLVVKLIDQYPDDDSDPTMRGYQLMTNEEIFRGRYLKAFDKPAALRPKQPREFRYSLHAIDHVFKKGHTIMVEVQSTWFPLYDRNPQTFVPNIMTAHPGDYQKATVTILSDKAHPSSITLPLVNGK
jgi:putative CocE/NonD family hydrolase